MLPVVAWGTAERDTMAADVGDAEHHDPGRSPRPPRGLVARLLPKLAAACLSFAIVLPLAEVVLRVFGGYAGYRGNAFAMPDPELSWVNKPGADVEVRGRDFRYHVRINSHGLRGDELAPDADPRVLLIGDSYTFGQGVDDEHTIAVHLERLLTESGREHAATVNAGVYGYGALQAKLLALRHWDRVRPDIVVYTHCGNDFADDLRFSRGTYRRIRNAIPGRQFLREHSAAYHVLSKAAVEVLALFGAHNNNVRFEGEGEGALVSDVGREWQRARDLTCGALDDLMRMCTERGARFFVTTVGFGSSGGTQGTRFSSDAEAVRQHCQEAGIPFLDPTSAFPEVESAPWTNRNSAGHFSPLGSRLFAQSLMQGLEHAEVLR